MDWQQEVVEHRRALHQIPELGHQEHETQAYLMDALRSLGLRPEPIAGTGVVVDVEGRTAGRSVALRSEMDGLPLQETTGLPFASRHSGLMHACGHDGHMAIVLGVARRLAERGLERGRVRLFFQPAEEKHPGGALDMIRDGVLNGMDSVIGLHLQSPDAVGTAILHPGPIMANSDRFRILVQGHGGHASEPESTKDAVLIGSQIVTQLQTIVSRRVPATEPAVVTCGAFHAGSAANIIADTAEILGTVRTLSHSVQSAIAKEIAHMAETTAALYGAAAEVTYTRGYPAVINDAMVTARWSAAIQSVVELLEHPPIMGGEDFSHYLHRIPGGFLLLGCRPDEGFYPHHSPHFVIDERALPIGVEVLWQGALAMTDNESAG